MSLMSHLQRNFGRLYAAQQRYQESMSAFAVDIYYSCLQHGPDHIRTAPSYFHMGRVFQAETSKVPGGKYQQRAEGFYRKVVDNCRLHLERQFLPDEESSSVGTEETSSDQISAVELEEVCEIVKHIEDVRVKNALADSTLIPLVVEAQYCLGLLFLALKDPELAKTSFLEVESKGTDEALVAVACVPPLVRKAGLLLARAAELGM